MLVNSYLRDAHVPPPDEPLDVDKDAYSRRTLHPATNGEAVELSAQFGEVVPARGVNSGPSRGSGKTRGRPAMVGVIRRLAIAGAAAFVPVAFVTVVCPGVSNAAECGFGTVFDPPTTLVWRHHFHRHCHLRRPRRQLGTAISRRTSRSVSARTFRSCRCAPASNPTGGARHGAKQPLTCCCV